VAGKALRPAALRVAAAVTRRWRPYSRLFFVGEPVRWVIGEELDEIARLAKPLGIKLAAPWPLTAARGQAVFFGSHFVLFDRFPEGRDHRLGAAYFHGRPGTPGMPEFDQAYAALRSRHSELHRIQVSHREMEEVVLSSGIDPAKVFRIPIGIAPRYFPPRTAASRSVARRALGLPEGAFVVGSFQKDGVGWGEGRDPKWIKGPDVLVAALSALFAQVPELHVLLSGPARGYVKAELDQRGIPYVHRMLERYADVGDLYAALDAYVVPARQEGGPKGVLEAMSSAVPLVTTRVGQAADLVRDGENGWLVDVADVEAIADRLERIAFGLDDIRRVTDAGLATAAANSYEAQLPLWRAFFAGFVESA
jgi:glycosyltransferase involved in cell wall biosynthesis